MELSNNLDELFTNPYANYFCKKALKNTSNRCKKGELLSVLSGFYHDLKKYYMSIGYGKITLKYMDIYQQQVDKIKEKGIDKKCVKNCQKVEK